jgi:hypothetical protein
MKQVFILITAVFLLLVTQSYSQISNVTNTDITANTEYVGWDGTVSATSNAKDVDVKNLYPNKDIKFYTDDGTGINLKAIVSSLGDINLINGGGSGVHINSYQINGQRVLWHNDDVSSIFVGADAGLNTIPSPTNPRFNTFMGSNAGVAINHIASSYNTFVGSYAGSSATNTHTNTFIGAEAGKLASSPMTGNAAVGYQCLYQTQAYGGCALGWQAGYSNTIGCGIVAIGEVALKYNTLGNYNIAIGYNTMYSNTTSNYNVAIGPEALWTQNFSNGSPPGVIYDGFNVALGYKALYTNNPTSTTTGIQNTGIGTYSLKSNTTGYNNSALGYWSGYRNLTGNNNTYLGYFADAGSGLTALKNSAAIGANANVMKDDNMILGDPETRVGVGLSGVSAGAVAKLDVLCNTPYSSGTLHVKTAGNFYETGAYSGHTAADFIAVYGKTDVTHSTGNNAVNLGGDFYATNGDKKDIGVRASAVGTDARGLVSTANGLLLNYGVDITAGAATSAFNYGVRSIVTPGTPIAAATNIGVYSLIPPTGPATAGVKAIYGDLGPAVVPCPGLPCPPGTAPDYAGYFNGDVMCTTGIYAISDENLKTDVQDIEAPMDVINMLNPKSYSFNQTDNESMQLPRGMHYGFLAQELEEIVPSLVAQGTHPARYDEDGTLTYELLILKPSIIPNSFLFWLQQLNNNSNK